MRILLISLLTASLIFPAQVMQQGIVGTKATSGVTINNSDGVATCTNASTTCSITSKVISATGDAAATAMNFCFEATCLVNPTTLNGGSGCTVGANDGTNTYTQITGSGTLFNASNSNYFGAYAFVAKNATAGTYTINFTISGTGCSFSYNSHYWFDFVGANLTTPIDSLGSGTDAWTGTGTSATPSIVSTGNVSTSGSVGIGIANTGNALTATGVFSLLTNVSTNRKSFSVSNPTAGGTLTFSGSQTSSTYYLLAFVVKP